MKKKKSVFSALLFFLTVMMCFFTSGTARADHGLTSFDANGPIHSIALQADGKILVSGDFSTIGGVARSYFARLNADGTFDTGFNTGIDFAVKSIVVQPDSKILLIGGFANSGGYTKINRLNVDGTLDTGFNPSGFVNPVNAIALQSDGKILVACDDFAQAAPYPLGLGRLNADGTIDNTFFAQNDATDGAMTGSVHYLGIQPDGKIWASASWGGTGSCGTTLRRLNADGSKDLNYGFYKDEDGIVRNHYYSLYSAQSFAFQADGKILIGQLGGSLIRLNADGSADSAFNGQCVVNGLVFSIAVQSDGKILVGGTFTTINGETRNHIARINADGTLDTGFNPDASGDVDSIVVQPNGKILVGGHFGLVKDLQQTVLSV